MKPTAELTLEEIKTELPTYSTKGTSVIFRGELIKDPRGEMVNSPTISIGGGEEKRVHLDFLNTLVANKYDRVSKQFK